MTQVMDKWSPRVWHRRASRPVSIWMMVFLAVGMVHFVVPNYPWVLVHIFTLGIVSNSIVVWSTHLAEKFAHASLPPESRPGQLRRIYVLNAGIVITLVGNMFTYAPVTIAGAAVVSAMMMWQCASLTGQWRQAAQQRFAPVVAAYVASAAFLPMGAFFGGWLSLEPGNQRLLMAHIACNVLGFVGLAAAGSLTILFPAIWRNNGISAYMTPALWCMAAGVVACVVGAMAGFPQAGLIVYTAGWVLNWQQWLGNLNRKAVSYPALSVLCAVTWLVMSLSYLCVRFFFDSQPALPVRALLVGFAAQLLIGVMSYLLPTTMGGGPQAVRVGLAAMGGAAWVRIILINGGLAAWVSVDNSYARIVCSILCLGTLASSIVFTKKGVSAQRQVLMARAAAGGSRPQAQEGARPARPGSSTP